MYLVKTPRFMQAMFPNYTWNVKTDEKVIYLTFDDGPIPEVTPWVLETLEQHNAKATFFCVGENVEKHPSVFQQVLNAGHFAVFSQRSELCAACSIEFVSSPLWQIDAQTNPIFGAALPHRDVGCFER